MEKKPYTPPVVTSHGKAVEKTQGFGGAYYEPYNPKPTSPIREWDD